MAKISAALPTHMKAVVLKEYDGTLQSLAAADFSVPRLRSGQVLIKLAATSIGPADLMFLRGQYGIVKPLPVVPGFEGSGTVIASGGGLMGRWLVGKRAACLAPEDGQGTWAEYMVTSADVCIPLFKHISFEQGAYLTINPMTALALLEIARTGGHLAFVQTAAASALGVMIARLAKRFQLTGIHIVRRPEQVQKLKSLGCEHVFDSNDASFQKRRTAVGFSPPRLAALSAATRDLHPLDFIKRFHRLIFGSPSSKFCLARSSPRPPSVSRLFTCF